MDFVTIVTPNFAHFATGMMALENGFNVVVEKPMTFYFGRSKIITKKSRRNRLIALSYAYLFRLSDGETGQDDDSQMERSERSGKLYVEYPQGWLSKLTESEGNAQAALANRSNKSREKRVPWAILEHMLLILAEYITGLKITNFVPI